MKNLFISFVLLFATHNLIAMSSTVAVTFTSKLARPGSSTFSIAGEGSPSTVTTLSTSSDSDMATVLLRPGKDYLSTFKFHGAPGDTSFYSQGFVSFVVPDGYRIYIDGQPFEVWTANLSSLQSADVTSHIVLRSDDDNTAAGFGSFSGITINKSVRWSVGLGGLRNGRSAGRYIVNETDLSPGSMADSSLLTLAAAPNNGQILIIHMAVGAKFPQGAVTVVNNATGGGYTMNFFYPSQAIGMYSNGGGSVLEYTLSGTPWRTIGVTAPSDSQLKITETEGATVRVSLLTLNSGTIASGAFVCTLQEGDGTVWLRTTTHTSTVAIAGQREDVVVVRTGDTTGTICTKTLFHYNTLPWGEELTKMILDPDGAKITSQYVYYTDPTYYGNYRKVKSVTEPTGNWTSYAYYDDWNRRGRLQLTTKPYQNLPSTVQAADITVGSSVSYDYEADYTGRYGNESSRIYKIGRA